MTRGRPRKYCRVCHKESVFAAGDTGLCVDCRKKRRKDLRAAENKLWTLHVSRNMKGITPKDMSPEDRYKKEWKRSKLSKILKKHNKEAIPAFAYDGSPIVPETVKDMKLPKSIKKMHCATKELTVYERLDRIEDILQNHNVKLNKLIRDIKKLNKQIFGVKNDK